MSKIADKAQGAASVVLGVSIVLAMTGNLNLAASLIHTSVTATAQVIGILPAAASDIGPAISDGQKAGNPDAGKG